MVTFIQIIKDCNEHGVLADSLREESKQVCDILPAPTASSMVWASNTSRYGIPGSTPLT